MLPLLIDRVSFPQPAQKERWVTISLIFVGLTLRRLFESKIVISPRTFSCAQGDDQSNDRSDAVEEYS
jgi:hypothetical protein